MLLIRFFEILSGEDGLLVAGLSNDNTIAGNVVHASAINGISVYESHFSSFSNNEIFLNKYHGISLRDNSSSIVVSDNEIYGNTMYGISLDGSYTNVIRNNDLHDNQNGIIIARSRDNVLELNEIHNNSFGLSMEFVENAIVSGCDVYNNVDHGIQLKNSRRSKVWKNEIHDNSADGVHISGSENIAIYSNVIANNSEYGVQLLDLSSQNLLMYNTISQNGYGVYVYEGDMNLIFSNIFVDNQNFNVRDNDGNSWKSNFYDDYTGRDLDGDLVGDEPYVILGRRGAVSYDAIPMMVQIWSEEKQGPLMSETISGSR